MPDRQTQRLSFREAAGLIYQTDDPSGEQIRKIRDRLGSGVLEGSLRGRWVAADSVARYLAARTEKRRLAAMERDVGLEDVAAGRSVSKRGRADQRHQADRSLRRAYRHGLRDYFRAVIRRQSIENASPAFRRAVLLGQIAVILFPALVLILSYNYATAPPTEHVLVEQWIDAREDRYEILAMDPPQPHEEGRGAVVRVKYRYYPSDGKPVLTDRLFQVYSGEARLLSSTVD